MKVVYPALIEKSNDIFLVFVPDLMIYTEGSDLSLEDNGIGIPEPSSYDKAVSIAKEIHEGEKFDYTHGLVTIVDSDLTTYRKNIDKKMVRKNLTIPSWMNAEAERLKLNVSRVLQEALKEKFEILNK